MYAVAIVHTASYQCVSVWLTPLWEEWETYISFYIIKAATYKLFVLVCVTVAALQRRVWDSVCTMLSTKAGVLPFFHKLGNGISNVQTHAGARVWTCLRKL